MSEERITEPNWAHAPAEATHWAPKNDKYKVEAAWYRPTVAGTQDNMSYRWRCLRDDGTDRSNKKLDGISNRDTGDFIARPSASENDWI